MKSKIIKIGFLLPLCFFSFFFACKDTKTINESYYTFQKAKINVIKKGKEWRSIQIHTDISGLYARTVKIAQNSYETGNYVNAATMAFTANIRFTQNISNCNIRLLPSKKDITMLLETDLGQTLSDYKKMVNDGFAPSDKNMIEKNPPGLGKDTISIPRIFYFKEEPLFLKGKDVQIEFSIKTEDSKVFSDTTKLIHLDW